MFNQEIKERYLETIGGGVQQNLRRSFAVAESFERTYNMDLACFTPDMLGTFMEAYGFSEPESVRSRKAAFVGYADWYCEQIGQAEHLIREYDLFTFPYKELFAPTLTLEPEGLLSKLECVYPLDSAQPVIPAMIFAWLGIDATIALTMDAKLVDTKSGKIYAQDGSELIREMPECFRYALEVYEHTDEAERVQGQVFKVYAQSEGQFIKKMLTKQSKKTGSPYGSKEFSVQTAELRARYREISPSDESFSYTNVQRSGNFYRLHQLAKSGVDVYDIRNKDLVRSILGKSKRNHKDNMVLYTAYKEIREEAGLD